MFDNESSSSNICPISQFNLFIKSFNTAADKDIKYKMKRNQLKYANKKNVSVLIAHRKIFQVKHIIHKCGMIFTYAKAYGPIFMHICMYV